MEPAPTPPSIRGGGDAWADMYFKIARPRVIDTLDLAGFTRYQERAGSLLWSVVSLPRRIVEQGLDKTICWFIGRHPREVSLGIMILIVLISLPDDIPDVSVWFFRSLLEVGHWASRLVQYWAQDEFAGLTVPQTVRDIRPLVVGIIPDGNRRWGKAKGVGANLGHFYGAARVMECVRAAAIDPRVGHLVIYVMSYDNLQKRSREEQDCLLSILKGWVTELHFLESLRLIRMRAIGEPSEEVMGCLDGVPLNPDEGDFYGTHSCTGENFLRITLLIGYDGRREIQMAKGEPSRLWLQDDLDGVIRTGGTRRASGFCTYQTGYSEWFFDDTMWPDMTPVRFCEYIDEIEASVGRQNHGK